MPKKLTRNRPSLARHFRRRLLPAAIMAAGQALYSLPAFAGPDGGKVTGGDGTIEYNGEVTTIEQLSDRLAIDWDSFDISPDELGPKGSGTKGPKGPKGSESLKS